MVNRFKTTPSNAILVYTDGCCLFNGQYCPNGHSLASAGIGVWFNNRHKLNVSEKVDPYTPQTNQRAELLACIRALTILRDNSSFTRYHDVELRTDSRYVVDAMTKWIFKWIKNGWKNALGNKVANTDLFVKLWNLQCQRINDDYSVEFVWVGRESCRGIMLADELAKDGADKDYF